MPDRDMFDWDYYSILGVKPDATTAEIKSAWKRLQKIVHPDRAVPGDEADRKSREETSKRVNNAWQVLGNERTRREYDAYRSRQRRTAPAPGPAAPPTPRRGPRPGGIDIDIDLEDLLRRARRAEPPKQDRRSPHGPKREPDPRGPRWNPGYEPPRRPRPGPDANPGYEPPLRSRPGAPQPSDDGTRPGEPRRRPPKESEHERVHIDLDEMLRHARRGRPPTQDRRKARRPRGPQPSPADKMRPREPVDHPLDDPGQRPRRAAKGYGPWIDERPDLGGDLLRPDRDGIRKEPPRDFRHRPEHGARRDGNGHERRPTADGDRDAARDRNTRPQPHGRTSAPPVRGAGRPVGGHRSQPPGAHPRGPDAGIPMTERNREKNTDHGSNRGEPAKPAEVGTEPPRQRARNTRETHRKHRSRTKEIRPSDSARALLACTTRPQESTCTRERYPGPASDRACHSRDPSIVLKCGDLVASLHKTPILKIGRSDQRNRVILTAESGLGEASPPTGGKLSDDRATHPIVRKKYRRSYVRNTAPDHPEQQAKQEREGREHR